MSETPPCPKCKSELTWSDGTQMVCGDCGHEWIPGASAEEPESDGPRVVKDANGTVLADGDSVVLVKDLKVKGSSTTLKVGSKIRNIRIVEGDHELDCKTEAGPMMLKAAFVKKA
jgi:protein PhnA